MQRTCIVAGLATAPLVFATLHGAPDGDREVTSVRRGLRGEHPAGLSRSREPTRRLDGGGDNVTRETWNGCECASNWTLPGYPHCEEACCNPENDTLGAWCNVKDPECEDGVWGYCRPVNHVEVPGCRDDPPSWTDNEGDDCDSYRMAEWCTTSGEAGPGWKADWGSFAGYQSNGVSPVDACCACGGGKKPEDCVEDTGWVDMDGDHCQEYVSRNWCNPDGSLGAGWHKEWGSFQNFSVTTPATVACCGCGGQGAAAKGGSAAAPSASAGALLSSKGNISSEATEPQTIAPTPVAQPQEPATTEEGTSVVTAAATAEVTVAATAAETPAPTTAAVANTTAAVADDDDEIRVTFNGCSCRREWTDALGPHCSTSCCNIDDDPLGSWCYVEDSSCEEATWGYCVPKGYDELSSPGCSDNPQRWRDKEGSTCAQYFYSEWCTSDGGQGPNWKSEWGNLSKWAVDGVDAMHACCACGGGGEKFETCSDARGWYDTSGDTCASYALYLWCTASGGFGRGWHEDEWGTFGNFSVGGISAAEACCACGGSAEIAKAALGTETTEPATTVAAAVGGTEPATTVAAAAGVAAATTTTTTAVLLANPSPEAAELASIAARVTQNSCKCKKKWTTMDGDSCDDFCCNPESDARSSWCFVEDSSCEGLEWGYCQPYHADKAPGCQNLPRGWEDAEGDTCSEYEAERWCTTTGGIGLHWQTDWGGFQNYAKNGVTAAQTCCACGGGTTYAGSSPGDDGALLKSAYHAPAEDVDQTPIKDDGDPTGIRKVLMVVLALVLGCGLGWYCYNQRRPARSGGIGIPAAKYGRNYKAVDEW